MKSSHFNAQLALLPAMLIALVVYCGTTGWTIWISFTNSRMLPSSVFVGWRNYLSLIGNERWIVSVTNLAVFGGLFISAALALGFLLAATIDRHVRPDRVIYTLVVAAVWLYAQQRTRRR